MKKSFGYGSLPFEKMPSGYRKLDVSNAIYLVNHDMNGRKISGREFRRRINEVEDFFVSRFGGHTRAAMGSGEFLAKNEKIIKEKIVRIESFCDNKTFRKHREFLRRWLIVKKDEWDQEFLGYEFQGVLYYL